jgi:site-specific recombinase XerD
LDESQYFNTAQIARLMRAVARAWRSRKFLRRREAFVIHLGLSTGLRVAEMANLRLADLQLSGPWRSVVVQRGKGGKRRVVRISRDCKQRCLAFIEAKQAAGEPVRMDAPVFYSPATGEALTTRALQKAFKRLVRKAGLGNAHSFHALRHTYGTRLCRASNNNLRLVQRQMGHDSIETTALYLHVENQEVERALAKLSAQLHGKGSKPARN